eukprot:jgi/Tetstr1/425949/TSEL_016300.t2
MIRLIKALEQKLKRNRAKFGDFFNRFSDSNGRMNFKGLQRFLREILGNVDMPTVRYFQAIVDINGDNAITLEELSECIQETISTVAKVSKGELVASDQRLRSNFQAIADKVLSQPRVAREVFDRCDENRDGRLEPAELRVFLKHLQPMLRKDDCRMLLAHFQSMDINRDGVLSFDEVADGMQAHSSSRRSQLASGQSDWRSRYSGSQPNSRIGSNDGRTLSLTSHDGRPASPPSLLSRESSFSSGPPSPTGAHPQRSFNSPYRKKEASVDDGANNQHVEQPQVLKPPQSESPPSSPEPEGTAPPAMGLLHLYDSMLTCMKENQIRFSELFNRYDRSGRGRLSMSDLYRFAADVLDVVDRSDVKYLQAMLDANGDGFVSLMELKNGLREGRHLAAAMADGSVATTMARPATVEGLQRALADTQDDDLVRLFKQCDVSGNGYLEPSEVGHLVRELAPEAGLGALRLSMALIYASDTDGDGRLSMREGGQVRLAAPTEVRDSLESELLGEGDEHVEAAMEEVQLQALVLNGKQYLYDPVTRGVHRHVEAGAASREWGQRAWPERIGYLTAGGQLRLDSNRADEATTKLAELYNCLYKFMKDEHKQFREKFAEYDSRGCGKLRKAEMRRLLQHVLGEVSSHEVEYLWAMLDINDDGEVSVEEFKSALREVKDVADGMREDHERRMEAEKLRVLNQISGELVARKVRAKTLFMRHSHAPHGGCTPRKGYLQPSQVGAFLAELLPGLSRREVRFGMLHLFGLLDADGDGRISFGEFVKGLRAVHMILPSGTLQPGFRPSSGGSSPWHSPRGDRPPATPQGDSCGLGTGGSEPMELTLEEYEHKGRLLLLEPATRTLFDPRAEEVDDEGTGWPMRVGYLTSGGAVRLTQATSGGSAELARLYQAVDAFIKESGMRFDELFAQFDSSGSGKLRMEQLQHLLDAVVGMVSAGQAQYLQAMLDTDGDGAVTLAEFKAAMREVSEVVLMGAGDVRAEQKALAERLSRALRQDPERTQALFQELDQARRGYLDPPLLMRFIRALLPGLSSRQARLAVDHLGRTMDANGDGRVSFKELLLGLRAVNLRQPSTYLPARSHPVRNDGDWQLQNFEHAGEPLLLDPASQRLYTLRADAPGEAPWPHEVGSLAEGGEVRLHSASGDGTEKLAQVYNAINDYIQDGGERLAALFKQFDTSRTGALRMEDLAAFLAEMVGDTPTSSVYYIHAMLDIDGDGLVTLPELKSALLEVKDVAASMEAAQGAELDREKRAALDALSRELRANQGRARELFQAHDVGDKGYLRPHEVRALIKGLLPAISARHLRLCLAHMCRMDTDQDGRISLFEFLHGLRAIQPRTSSGAAIFAGFAANPGHAPKESMEQVAIQERNLLIREPTLNDGSLDGILDDMGLSDDGGNVAHQRRATLQSVGSFENLLEFETSVAELQSECSFTADEGADAEEERWELHELWHRGERLLLDRRTNWLYRCQRDGGWPERVGHLTDNGDVVLGGDSATLGQGVMELAKVYNTALKYMEEERLRFQELFARYDTSGAGRLQLDDLHNMLEEMLGQVSGAQVLFLHAMLDVNGDGLVTLEEFRSALRQVAEVADGLRSHHDSELEAERRTTMAKLSQAMMKRKKRAKKLFRKLAGAKDWLAPPALGQLIRELVPGLSAREQRVALAYMLRMDADADGRVSWPEFLQGLRAVQVAVPSGTAPDVQMGFPTEAPSSFPPHLGEAGGDTSEWILEEVEYDGAPLLLDPATRVLYSVEEEENASGWWPRRFGSLASDGTVCPDHELSAGVAALAALYNGLQAAMDAEGVRFSQLFQQYDSSGRGLLAMDDLGRFLADMLGDGAPAEEAGLLYLQAMLDANGDGAVSEAEFRAALREVAEVAEGVRAEAAQREGTDTAGRRRALKRLSEALVERQGEAKALFKKLDKRGSAKLTPPQVAELLRRLLPGLSARELRFALAEVLAMDVNKDGQVSWTEFVRGMRGVRVHRERHTEKKVFANNPSKAARAPSRAGSKAPTTDSAAQHGKRSHRSAGRGRAPDARALGARRSEDGSEDDWQPEREWVLEAFPHKGRTLLLDPASRLLYQHDPAAPDPWPTRVGRLAPDGSVALEAATSAGVAALAALYNGLQAAMDAEGVRFSQLFRQYDSSGRGLLAMDDLGRFLADMLGDGAPAEEAGLLYLQAMLDANGDGAVSEAEFRAALREVAEVAEGVRAEAAQREEAEAREEAEVLAVLSEALVERQADARALFRQLDTRRSGRLRPPQVAQLTRRLLPSLMPRQLRLALAHLLALDADGDGQLSWGELVHGMRATRVRLPERGALEGGFRARMVGSASHAGRRPGENQPKPLPHETFSFHPDSAELMLPPATKTAKDWHPADASSSEAARRENPAADAHLQGVEAFFEAAQHVGHFHFELEGVLLKRQAGTERLLLERRTNLVYVPVRNAWPRLAGCLKGDRFVHREAMTPGSNIFSALCRAFTGYKNEHHFNHLFNELDGDRDGWLSLSEVQRLASQVFQVTPGHLEHMRTMLSLQPGAAPHGRPVLSAETLRTGLLDCAELSTGALAGRPAALAALDSISNCIGDDPRAAWESFLELAGAPLTSDPELSQRQLSKLLSSLGGGRAIDNRDVQSCLAYLHSLDVDGTGRLGFLQLLQALRCVTVCFGPPNRRMVCLPGFSSLAGSCNWAESRPAPSAPSSPPKSRRRVQSEAPPQPPQPQPPLDLASELREPWPPPSRKPSGGTVRYASHSALPHAGHTGAGSLAEELHQVEPRTEEVHAPKERKPEAGLSLVDALLDGCLVLVHRPSGLVFRQATERAWPELVGRLDGEGQLGAASAAALATSQPSPLAVMFHLLEALLEALHQLEDGRLVELFLQADPSAQGLGGAATLEAVVRPVLPDLRPQEAALLTGLLGAHPWPRMMGPSNLVEVLADGLAAVAMAADARSSLAAPCTWRSYWMVLRLVQPQAEAARLQMVAAYVMDHHACRSGRVTFEALMFSMRCVKLVAGSQTFHPEAAFPGLAQATAEAAQVDLELLVGTPTEGRISEEALMKIRMAIAGIQEERGGAMQHMSVGGVAAAEDKPAVQAGLMRKLRVAALQGGQLREAYGAVASKGGGLLEQHHLPQLLQQLAPDLPQAGVQYCCAMLQSHGGGTQPLDLPDLESIITHAAQLEYLLQDNGQLTSAMQHLVAALEADIQRDYPRAEQIWTDVSGCAPSQGIGLQKVLAVAARLPQQQLQSRECRTLTAILAAALPAACWLPHQGDPPSARKAHRVPATDPSSLRRSLQSDGHRLSLPRFTRLLTQLSLFGLADTEPASLVAERRPAGPHAYSSLKGVQYQSGEAGGSQWSSPDPAGSPSVPAEDWAADSLPPGYLEWVQAQHGSAMWLWQQDQARKASEAAMQREMSLRDAEVSDLKAKMSDLELELEHAKEALAKPRPGLGIDLDASDCSSSDSRNEAQAIVNKLLKQVHTLGKVMESGGLPGEAADSEAAIAHQTLLQRLPSLVAEGDPSEIIAWMEEEWRRETAPMEDELQILSSSPGTHQRQQQQPAAGGQGGVLFYPTTLAD